MPCLGCQRPTRYGPRCPRCAAGTPGAQHRSPSSKETGRYEHQQGRAALVAQLPLPCHLCGGIIEDAADLHADHVVPVAAGGAGAGLLPAHKACNLRRGAR